MKRIAISNLRIAGSCCTRRISTRAHATAETGVSTLDRTAERHSTSTLVTFEVWAEVVDVLSIDRCCTSGSDFQLTRLDRGVRRQTYCLETAPCGELDLAEDLCLAGTGVDANVEPHHKGCKSWVDIDPAVDIGGSEPVLKESDWKECVREIQGLIQELVPTQ